LSEIMAIVVLYFNKVRLTDRCLNSLLDAGVSSDRIYCMDNGSEPAFADKITNGFPELNHHKLKKNQGFSGGFNAALNQVFHDGYDQCLFLTNDTIFHRNTDVFLSNCLNELAAGMVAPCIRYLSNPDKIDSLGAFFRKETANLGHYHEYELPVFLQPDTDYIPGTALAITKKTFEILQGTDESFHTYWEDVDLSFRASAAGIKLARCPRARIDHAVGQTCHKKPFYTTYLFQRNRLKFCRNHLRGMDLQNAENLIRLEWLAMLRQKQEKGDLRRVNYIEELLTLF